MHLSARAAIACLGICSMVAVRAGGRDAAAAAHADPFAAPPTATGQLSLRQRLDDEAIARAVRETLAETHGVEQALTGTALSGDSYNYTKFARQFDQAAKGHCLGPDALKHQPASRVVRTVFGDFNVGVGGPLALPFWGAAILRGKCSWRK